MLFKNYHIPMIKSRIKTETRRNWKRKMAKVGGTYPIQTKMFQPKTECEKLRVTYMFQQKLGDMNQRDAKKEGNYTIDQFIETFEIINGSWNDDLIVWVIGFDYLEDGYNYSFF